MKRLFFLFIIACYPGGCDHPRQDFFPLGNNTRWEYIIEEKVNDKRGVLKSLVANLERQTIEGIEYYPRRNANGETYYFIKTEKGIFISPAPGHSGKIILGFPVQAGTSWQTETAIEILQRRHESFSGGESFISADHKIILDFHIASMDDIVEVPAGQFSHCMRIEGIGSVTVKARTRGIDHILIEQQEWYAQGVGLVKQMRTEVSIPEKYRGYRTQELVKWDP